MTSQDDDTNETADQTSGFAIRWHLILAVVAIWAAYIGIASILSETMVNTWSLVAVFGALTASALAVWRSRAVKAGPDNQSFAAKHERSLAFVIIAFSIATFQAAAFCFYFLLA